ncbi:MAG: type I DNA topoisomerase [Bacteroidia bacterium]
MKNLVIVESPAKAKTIEKFLGKDFKVVSCKGHIRDLADGNDAIDISNGFAPKYEVSPEKTSIVKDLKKYVKSSEIIWLATDEDREGEAISWHLYEELKLQKKETKRIVFNEITKPAILKAVDNPRQIDNFLVDAQQARRILDRLVGYGISPILWKRVQPNLSAGRVQSVSVRLVVEREREIFDFQASSEYRIWANLKTVEGKIINTELQKRPKTKDEAKVMLNELKGAQFNVDSVEVKPTYRNPAPPFTTSTLQQEAARKLGYGVGLTMQLAQKLYENGHITYMRTDSTNLSHTAVEGAKQEILDSYGDKFSAPKNFATKNSSAQEAHEAIRPTYFNKHEAGNTPQEKRLYQLIWKRAIASQMSKAELEKTIITFSNNNNSAIFKADGEVMKFEGFLKVYLEGTDDENDEENAGLLPKVNKGEKLVYNNIIAKERFSKHPPRYTEASLVKKLEELGIGRPSTYAPTIQTIQNRGYISKESRSAKVREVNQFELTADIITEIAIAENYDAESNKLFPSDIGMLVTDFLSEHFKDIMDYGFTASVEKEFDEIAQGLKSWQEMLKSFYNPFKSTIEKTESEAERVRGERVLGTDTISGLTVLVRMGKFGPMVQLGSSEETETPQFASLLNSQRLESITFDEAIQLLSLMNNGFEFEGQAVTVGKGKYGPYLKYNDRYINLDSEETLLSLNQDVVESIIIEAMKQPSFPLDLGEFEDSKISVGKGRFGPYVKHGSLFASIPKTEDPLNLTLERAIELISEKREAEKKKLIKEFEGHPDTQILKGRYGPYIKHGKENLKIPKGVEAENVTIDQILEIAKAAPAKKKTTKKTKSKK